MAGGRSLYTGQSVATTTGDQTIGVDGPLKVLCIMLPVKNSFLPGCILHLCDTVSI